MERNGQCDDWGEWTIQNSECERWAFVVGPYSEPHAAAGFVEAMTSHMNDEHNMQMSTSRRPKVFICYAHEDATKAQELFLWLKAAGADPWLDKRRLALGDDWKNSIERAVAETDIFVVCLRPDFDRIGFKHTEVRWAREALQLRPPGQGFIIPFIIEPCELPEWCKRFHAGSDLSKPTSLDDLLQAIEKHCNVKLTDHLTRGEFLPMIERARDANATTLDLSDRGLPPLPGKIGELTSLEVLELKFNKLTQLPPEIGDLTNLRVLDLGDNELKTLPPEIGRLGNLERLYLYRNEPLETLPPEIGRLSNLRYLVVYRSGLTALPREIGRLSKLERLELGGTGLTALPPEIGQLTSLRELILDTLSLTAFPSEITHLTNLKELDLKRNRLTMLPPEIGRLTNLEVLDLHRNRLNILPSEIGQLANLKVLDLRDNPLPIPPEVANLTREPAEIIGFYLQQRRAAT